MASATSAPLASPSGSRPRGGSSAMAIEPNIRAAMARAAATSPGISAHVTSCM